MLTSTEHTTAHKTQHYYFLKSTQIEWVQICWSLFPPHNVYLCHTFSFANIFFKVLSGLLILERFTFKTATWMWGCIKQFPVKLRKQIKIWLWEIPPVKHNSRTGQTRSFLFLWGDFHCQAWKWWNVGLCEKRLMHLSFRWKGAKCMHQISHNFLVNYST